jgi:hypothetical protein
MLSDSFASIPSPSTSLRTGSVEEWSDPGGRDIDGKAERPSERSERVNLSILFLILPLGQSCAFIATRPRLQDDLPARAPFA